MVDIADVLDLAHLADLVWRTEVHVQSLWGTPGELQFPAIDLISFVIQRLLYLKRVYPKLCK